MSFDSFGAPQFSLEDCKIATWNATDDYSTAVDVPSVQMMGGNVRMLSGELEGDSSIQAVASRAIAGEVRIRFGSLSIAALEVLLGNTSYLCGSTPNQQDLLQVNGGDNMPYIGICGKALAEEGNGDTHVFYAKAKITSDFELASLEYGQFAIPEVTLTAVPDATYGIAQMIEHETAEAVTIPPGQS